MRYTLRNETAKDRFERLVGAYKFHYKRTNGKEVEPIYTKGYVHVNVSKVRLNKFEDMLQELKSRPSFTK